MTWVCIDRQEVCKPSVSVWQAIGNKMQCFLSFREHNSGSFQVLSLFPRPHLSLEPLHPLHPVLCAYFWACSGDPEECLLGNSACK